MRLCSVADCGGRHRAHGWCRKQRDDNRIENLELWVKPQPTGIRAVEAVEWAREILARYDAPVETGKRAS